MKNKFRFFILVFLMFSITGFILLWALADISRNSFSLSSIVMLIALVLIIIFAVYALRRVYSSLKKGDPFKDERTRKIEMRASALSFILSIYWLLFIGFAIDTFKLEISSSSVPGLGIAGMAVFFGLSYWYFSKKGE
jgi:hypothetical protein